MEETKKERNITDIVNSIKTGIIVVFFDETKFLVYHECKRQYIIPTESVIYIDCRNSPLLNDDRLTNMLDSFSVRQCDCNIKNITKAGAKFGKIQFGRVS